MKITRYASATEIKLENGTVVLVSYSTPVAAFIPSRGFVRSEDHYSRTTSDHISKFLSRNGAPLSYLRTPTVSAAELAALLGGR